MVWIVFMVKACDFNRTQFELFFSGKRSVKIEPQIAQFGSDKLRNIYIMEAWLGEFWIFKLACLGGVAYLIYVFIKDRRGK